MTCVSAVVAASKQHHASTRVQRFEGSLFDRAMDLFDATGLGGRVAQIVQ